jgi:cytosine/adenosine deaminase-related metal-dependent hydrolase
MADEVRLAAELDILDDRLIAVHLVGVDSDGVDLLARRGVTAAWCPTSNDFLFGRTASAELLDRLDVVIGSDSMLTGAGTLLDELRHAHETGLMTEERLLSAVGHCAALKLRINGPVLAPNTRADFVVLGRSPLEATCEDVHLVVVSGVPRVADERYGALFELLATPFEPLRVGEATKLVSAPLGSVVERILAHWPQAGRIFSPRAGSAGSGPPA